MNKEEILRNLLQNIVHSRLERLEARTNEHSTFLNDCTENNKHIESILLN
jgi:hypothetical protein